MIIIIIIITEILINYYNELRIMKHLVLLTYIIIPLERYNC